MKIKEPISFKEVSREYLDKDFRVTQTQLGEFRVIPVVNVAGWVQDAEGKQIYPMTFFDYGESYLVEVENTGLIYDVYLKTKNWFCDKLRDAIAEAAKERK